MVDNISRGLISRLGRDHDHYLTLDNILSDLDISNPIGLRHPHGFFVIPLITGDSEWRLHVWPQGTRSMSTNLTTIHTHDKLLDSQILIGELTNITYKTEEALADGQPVYDVNYSGSKYLKETANVLTKTKFRLKIQEQSRQELLSGQRYSIAPHVFHQTEVPRSSLTCTLVRMHSYVPGPVQVLGRDTDPDLFSFHRQDCAWTDIRNMIGL